MLLHARSITVQILLLVLIELSRTQKYDPDYHISSDDDDGSSYTADDQERPDYSKYFNLPQTAPQLDGNSESGFVAPLSFPSFFGSPSFGFSAGNVEQATLPVVEQTQGGFVPDDFKQGFADGTGFGAVDYFEQAQKESRNEENTEEGPSYISSNVPTCGGYEDEISNFRQKTPSYKSQPKETKEEEEEKSTYTDFKPSPVDLTQFTPTNSDYYKKYTQASPSPYQQFGFQSPQASNYGLRQNNAAPYNPSHLKLTSSADANYEYLPSQSVTQNLKYGECVKINKKVPAGQFNKEPMTCYVCKDPKSGSKSEHCSYEQEPSPRAYYRSTSKSYGNPASDPYRIKREDSEAYVDPYEEVKSKSHRYYSQPDEFEKDYYKAPDFSQYEDYAAAAPEKQEEEEDEKSYSEQQSEEIVKQKDKCRKIHKEGVTCLVCQNPESGGNYEQCSYQSEPNEKKYAYVRESKYDGDAEQEKDDEESRPVSESRKYNERESADADDDEEKTPQHFVKSNEQLQKGRVTGLQPKLYGDRPKSKAKHRDSTVFPRYSNEESKQAETRAKPQHPHFDTTAGKRDVERVLEEFTKKDRSNCEQIKKKGMTCYLCVNKKGIQHEECMYVSESRPQSSLIAYHEKELLKDVDKPNPSESESQIKTARVESKTGKFPKKTEDSEAHASNKKLNKKKRSKDEPEPKPGFNVNDKGGLYSAETQSVFVKSLGMTLPKYMVEKTDYEKDFERSAYTAGN